MKDNAGTELPQLVLKRHEDRRLRSGHLWVFSNEIDTAVTPLTAIDVGALVRIVDHKRQFVGFATANPHALICARLMSRHEDQPIGPGLIASRLQRALSLRERYVGGQHYRLVFGESDGLPGLVLDRYGDVVVGQVATWGMENITGMVETALRALLSPRQIVWKNDGSARDLEGLPKEVRVTQGEVPTSIEIEEAGLHFSAPLAAGQKTGWFYDQSANRAILKRYMRPGARVLDVCSYVGAWGVSAMANGAQSALCVDSSETALEWAQRNAERNKVALGIRRGDAFDVLEALHGEGAQFDVVVVDPPAFVKKRKDLPRGEAAYRKLNQLAMRLLDDDGLLVSCSCSYHLSADALPALLHAGASHLDRDLQIVTVGGQSPDHPIHPAVTETRYLKALFCRVVR
jgi:23S rRNA (cytosine1962-C5)-methyltransferase